MNMYFSVNHVTNGIFFCLFTEDENQVSERHLHWVYETWKW